MAPLGLYSTVVAVLFLSITSVNVQNPTALKEEPPANTIKISRLYLNALKYINELKDQSLADGVFDAILDRLNSLNVEDAHERNVGRYDMTTLLCWAVNNEMLRNRYRQQVQVVYNLAKKFYPERNDKPKMEREIQGRQPCSAKLPVTVITGFAWGDVVPAEGENFETIG